MTKKIFYTLWIVLFSIYIAVGNPVENKDEIDGKVERLLKMMTLEEKIGQLNQYSSRNPENEKAIRNGIVGSMLNVVGVENTNALQKIAVEETRLGIPLIFGLDVIHGYRTVFPISLGEAASWAPELVEKSARIAAKEATADGIHWTFAPMVDIARDARWGRISEGAGEDPYLGSVMAAARVRGFQGENLSDPVTLLACAKHFAAYGAAEAGKDYNTVDISEKTLREVYLPPFKAAVDAGVGTFMCSFNEINGIPSSGNPFLLRTILRDEWGFEGFVVSDWESVKEMIYHGNVGSEEEAAQVGFSAGVDMEMASGLYLKYMKKLINESKISEDLIDQSVRKILKLKYRLGLFENPYTNPEREKKELLTKEHLEFARELASKSIVLLKNDGNVLPLKKDIKSLAIIGPLAKDKSSPLGWWHCVGREDEVISAFEGIKSAISKDTKLHFAKGCDIESEDTGGFEEAIEAAKKSEVALVFVGESQEMSGEGGSRAFIGLPGKQVELVKALAKTEIPVVVILMNGRPLALPWIAENVPSILETWQLGTQSGNAIADVIFGKVNPGGKLPVTFPRAVGQEPLYYNHKNTGRPPTDFRFTTKYFDIDVTPQFPFGYGLSYTSFKYSDLALDEKVIDSSGKIKVTARITNTGKIKGDEIVQLYIRDLVGSLTRPVKELKGFQRVTLEPGESKLVEFVLNSEALGLYNAHMNYVVEPGIFKVWVGPNSVDGLEGIFEVKN